MMAVKARRKPKATPENEPTHPLRLEWRSPSELAENPANWRRHPDNQIAALSDTIAEVGWAGACLFNERTGRLIDGHARRKVAQANGADKIPVLVGSWSEEDERKILATLDPLAAMAESDSAALAALLSEVSTQSDAINAMLADLAAESPVLPEPGAGGDEFDATPAETGPMRTQPGDLWIIGGKHRLLVGDCTDAGGVAILMDGKKATCLFTDPPYGVSIGEKNRLLNSVEKAGSCLADIEDDDLPPDELKAQLLVAFQTIRDHLADDCSYFVCSPQGCGLSMMMMMMMQEACLPSRHIIIWRKNSPTFSMGRLDYDYQHEPILFGWKKTHKRNKEGPFSTSVWDVDKPRASPDHATQKPIELPSNAILNHTDHGDVVADIFLGSGTTLIAAHRLNRVCYGCEIEPRYGDVILKRCEAEGLTVEKAT